MQWASLVAHTVKNLPAKAGGLGPIPGSGRSYEGSGNPLQCSCLQNSMDRGAWRASIHGVTQSGARLTDRHFTSPGCSTQGFLGSRGTWLHRYDCCAAKSPVWESQRCKWRQFPITCLQRTEVKGHDPNSLTLQTHDRTQSFTLLQRSQSLHCMNVNISFKVQVSFMKPSYQIQSVLCVHTE